MLAVTYSGAILGVEAFPVAVEANSGEKGEPRCVLVGLPDTAVKESMNRVFSSLSNSGYSKPRTHVTINLAPGGLKKEGASFDLPIALSLLSSMGHVSADELNGYLIAGELGLSGEVREIRGGLTLAMLARKMGKKGLLVPPEAADEACLVDDIKVFPVQSLAEAVAFFESPAKPSNLTASESSFVRAEPPLGAPDFRDVKGQSNLRRAVEVAVAGSHNMMLIGSPGSGKSMISKRIPTILPRPSTSEYLEILNIYSAGGQSHQSKPNGWVRPFRSPHHTISDVGLIGGGALPGPGEISLAHNGILFLDELPEFKRSALEVLRQPLEDGQVTISRSAGKVTLPSRFMLIAAMNPCPCGYLGDKSSKCSCSIPQIQRYRSKISGPLLDRIDLHVEAPAVRIEELQTVEKGESSDSMRQRVEDCRNVQSERFRKCAIKANAHMSEALIEQTCVLGSVEMDLLSRAMKKLSLSARAYGRILKVARTIADLSYAKQIQKEHLLEAIQYRSLDRSLNN